VRGLRADLLLIQPLLILRDVLVLLLYQLIDVALALLADDALDLLVVEDDLLRELQLHLVDLLRAQLVDLALEEQPVLPAVDQRARVRNELVLLVVQGVSHHVAVQELLYVGRVTEK